MHKFAVIRRVFFIVIALVSYASGFAKDRMLLPADTLAGIITFGPEYEVGDTIKILNDNGTVWHWFVIADKAVNPKNQDFRPFTFDPDYFGFVLRVSSIKGNRYEVIANEETCLKKYVVVDKSKKLDFETIPHYAFRQMIGPGESTIYKSPGGEALNFKASTYRTRNLAMKGDWIQLEFINDQRQTVNKGWVRWRKGNEILVVFFKD